ncbi:MAG: double-strand break repair helicase AddA [Hyphomonadaceae bacterium]|nr:double-strand break repair helicase AddA [Hyphomonadaceae bacterium]
MSPREETLLNQRAAADPRANAFVTANAGSGKTKVLVDRIARLLLTGAAPNAFLCITYTKAAASEMQRRLLMRLGAWGVTPDDALAAALRELTGSDEEVDAADLARARALFAHALETPGGLRIQTIHAFCERLLARFPLESGVAPGFLIADDVATRDLMQRAWDDLLRAGEGDTRAAFARFARRLDGDSLEQLFKDIVAARAALKDFIGDGTLPEALQRLALRHGVSEDAETFIARTVRETPWRDLEAAARALAHFSVTDAERARKILAAHALRDDAPEAAFDALKSVFLTQKEEPYKSVATKPALKQHGWLEPLLAREAQRVHAATQSLRAIDRAADARAALILAHAFNRHYAQAKDAAGTLDFDDLITHALALLTRADAAPWVLYKLDGGVSHILVDEGQDTSPAQWRLLAPLQNEFFAGRGAREAVRTVFAVGDPKQSIYGFQGADPARFLLQAQTLSLQAHESGAAFRAPSLRASFRSTPEVLAAVDATMARLTLGEDAMAQDVVVHLADRGDHQGMVEVWPIARRPDKPAAIAWDSPRDMERSDSAAAQLCKAIAVRISEMIAQRTGVWDRDERGWAMRPMHAGDVLILVQSRTALFEQMIKALKRQGLPVAGADRMKLAQDIAVLDCMALIRTALDPTDDHALACVLKGPWLGLVDDDADLFPLAYGRAKGETLWSRLKASADPRLAPARAFIAAAIARAGAHPFVFLSWALEACDADGRSGWRRLAERLGAAARDPLEEVLSRALSADRRGEGSLQAFLAALEADDSDVKREMEEAGRAVRVMTAHGAKGLEAPIVFLPDTTKAPSFTAKSGFMRSEDGPVFSRRKADDDAVVASARARGLALAQQESARLLYVAMTRARDVLIVCGAQAGNGEAGVGAGAWHESVSAAMAAIGAPCETPFGQGFRLGALHRAQSQETPQSLPIAAPAWASRAVDAAASRGGIAPSHAAHDAGAGLSPRQDGARRFRRGLLIHGLLQRLPSIAAPARAAAAQAWLARQGFSGDGADAFVREALAVIDDPAIADAFGPASRPEAPIVGAVDGRAVSGVVDRLVVQRDRVLALDFKTDRPSPRTIAETPPAYLVQLALYRAVLRQIFPGRSVSCALVWTETPHVSPLPDDALDAALAALGAG